jgi:NCAIR mutase (PurE)-related protein
VNRTSFPEVVYGENKTSFQIHSIMNSLDEARARAISSGLPPYGVLATRVTSDIWEDIFANMPNVSKWVYNPTSRTLTIPPPTPLPQFKKSVLVITAGTTDIPVAEETYETLLSCGINPVKLYDCGVAGLHRIVSQLPLIRSESFACVIVIAGMDGALPSVVSGLIQTPCIAVPTSIGYGASNSGQAALGTMLNSCSPGVAVVNVDNGFGAAGVAFKICKLGGLVGDDNERSI